jgi:hypothetical protein
MQKIISLIFILSILCIKINAQTTVIDDGSFLYIQGSSIQRVHIHKDLCAVQKTADKVILTFSSNNTPFVFSWNVAQSTAYKGGLNQTYDYIVGLLNTISTSTPPPSPNAGDSLIVQEIKNQILRLDTTNIDTSLIQAIQLQQIIDSLSALINKPFDSLETRKVVSIDNWQVDSTHTSILNNIYSQILRLDTTQIDTALDKKILLDSTQVRILNDSIKVYFTQPLSVYDTTHQSILGEINTLLSVINSRIDTTQLDTSLINYFTEWNRNNDTLSAILQELKLTDSVFVINRDTAIVKVIGIKDTLYTYDLDTSFVYTLDSTYYSQLDSIISLLNTKDTIDFEFYKFCYRSKADSGVYNFNIIINTKNTSSPAFMNLVDVDSMTEIFRADYINNVFIGTFPNYANDYVPCERWEEYMNRLDTIKDTLKALVFKPVTKNITGTQDTLYNCKGLSFRANSGVSGTLVLYYEDGEVDSYDVANEDLPYWDNSSFISFVGYDASGVSGVVRINSVGCSQDSDVICAKEKPIINCAINAPILQCSGWASSSGIWSTISGCWNTGQ